MNADRRMIRHSMQGVFVFVLLGFFAVLSTLLVMLGAQLYHNTADRAARNGQERVLGAYVRSMVRAQDAAQAVSVEEHDGIRALALREWFDGEEYVTWLYCYRGSLCEQFTGAEDGFWPEEGTAICEASRFEPSLDGSLLTVEMTGGGDLSSTVRIALRCGQ